MAETLTPQQKEAVINRGGDLLVSAAAGSGKTKVLVDRLMRYLRDPVNPANLDDFLIITYTKAAAAELRGKISAKLSEAVAAEPDNRHLHQQMQRLYLTKISTVHAFCGDLLREYAYRLDICGDFRVADENECLQLQQRVLTELLEESYVSIDSDLYFRAFTDTQGFGRDDGQIPDLVLKVYNSARCHLHPDRWLDWCLASATMDSVEDAGKTVWGEYLVRELRDYLDLQISALDKCYSEATLCDGMEKPATLLQSTLVQLRTLRNADGWDNIRHCLNIDFGRLLFGKKCGDLDLAERIKAVRNACKKGLERRARWFSDDSDKIIHDISSVTDAASGLVAMVKKFSAAYDKLKKSHRILDFGDLEHNTLDLLLGKKRSGPTSVAKELGLRFREVMVDEYQDSNAVQDAIFSAITSEKHNCFMVGDVKQSIYQFRLADPDIFLKKYNRFMPAETAVDGQGRKVMLSSNFRSAGAVIAAVNDVFSTCMSPKVGGLTYGAEEALYEGLPHDPISEPEIELYGVSVREDTYEEEAAFVAERISQLLDGSHMVRGKDGIRPIVPGDIVILLRSPGSVGIDYQRALENVGIRCTMGGSIDLLRTEEITVLRALLQIIDNPLQDIPLLCALSSRIFSFTANDLAEFRKEDRRSDIYNVMLTSKHPKVRKFLGLLFELRTEARMGKLTDILDSVFAHTRIDSIYSALADGPQRLENLQSFCRFAEAAENNGISDLSRFLEYVESLEDRGITVQGEEADSTAVAIMSIHKSKGLEFPVVFLCGLSREFNAESSRATVLCDKELGIGLSCADTGKRIRYPSLIKTAISAKIRMEGISEELRVLYVAMTRARDRLIMTYAARNLEKELSDLALRMELSDRRLLTSEASCPGTWVLLTALGRSEAGAFFALSGPVATAAVKDYPWHIRVVEAPEPGIPLADSCDSAKELSADVVTRIGESLRFQYPYSAATQTPSKQTATQLKGREKDAEAAEGTTSVPEFRRNWRIPSFIRRSSDGRTYGNLIHSVMQHIQLKNCDSKELIREELLRLTEAGVIPTDQSWETVLSRVWTFFDSDIGRRIRTCPNVLREFKFSVLMDGKRYGHGLEEEKILLQGVVDFALIEEDGITVVDYKTDRVTGEGVSELLGKYGAQVNSYAEALSRIFNLPVKSKLIFLFSTGEFLSV